MVGFSGEVVNKYNVFPLGTFVRTGKAFAQFSVLHQLDNNTFPKILVSDRDTDIRIWARSAHRLGQLVYKRARGWLIRTHQRVHAAAV